MPLRIDDTVFQQFCRTGHLNSRCATRITFEGSFVLYDFKANAWDEISRLSNLSCARELSLLQDLLFQLVQEDNLPTK